MYNIPNSQPIFNLSYLGAYFAIPQIIYIINMLMSKPFETFSGMFDVMDYQEHHVTAFISTKFPSQCGIWVYFAQKRVRYIV